MEISREAGLIQLAIIYIKNDNLKELEKVLKVMPLEKLKDVHQTLLSNFLKVAA